MSITLRNNEGGPGFVLTLALMGFTPETVAESNQARIYYRWEDDPTMEPLFLGIGNAGETFQFPLDLKGRPIRVFAESVTEDGKRFVSNFAQMAQSVYSPKPTPERDAPTITATEALTAWMLVNIYDSSGEKVRKANATNNTKPAHGFVAADVASSGEADVFFAGEIISGLSGLTPGTMYYLSTAGGGVTATAPTGSGQIQQQIGAAISTTEILFNPQESIEVR